MESTSIPSKTALKDRKKILQYTRQRPERKQQARCASNIQKMQSREVESDAERVKTKPSPEVGEMS
jgi:hypothetical protein